MSVTPNKSRLFILFTPILLLAAVVFMSPPVLAHTILKTLIFLDVRKDVVETEIQIPLADVRNALKENILLDAPSNYAQTHSQEIATYLQKHIHPTTPDGVPWTVSIDGIEEQTTSQGTSGAFRGINIHVAMTPPKGASTRTFTFAYDAIIHNDSTHIALVSIRQDWANGVVGEAGGQSVGVIQTQADHSIPPLSINLGEGSLWKGFEGMVLLGMNHIRTGTDHLLFLLTLLIPAPLLVLSRRWQGFGGMKRSLLNILKITTAFTIGHSMTLIVSTLVHLNIPDQPIEALIAVTIIVSALHALRPIFPGREMYIAGGFGLIHGMAFSFTLTALNLDTTQLVTSLLGFNLGIEFMQVIIIAITMPSLLMLATTRVYKPLRIMAASLALVAALGWLVARVGYPNVVSDVADSLNTYGIWIILALAIIAMTAYYIRRIHHSQPVKQSESI